MKRILISIASYFIFLLSLFAQTKTRDLTDSFREPIKQWEKKAVKENMMKARVSTVSSYQFEFKFGKVDTSGKTIGFWEYDKKGNRIKEFEFRNYDNKLRYAWTMDYDNAGKILKATCYDGEMSNGRIERALTYEYLSDERVQVIEYDNSGSVRYKDVYKCDTNSDIIVGGSEKWIVRFDEKGKVIDSSHVGDAGKVIAKITYVYDTNGKPSERKLENYVLAGLLSDEQISKFDSLNNIIELKYSVRRFSKDFARKVFKYNDRGLLFEWVEYDQMEEPKNLNKLVYKYFDR